jgi:hypothetical protein
MDTRARRECARAVAQLAVLAKALPGDVPRSGVRMRALMLIADSTGGLNYRWRYSGWLPIPIDAAIVHALSGAVARPGFAAFC